jgi:transcriptional regulator with XRE-family HTH domain
MEKILGQALKKEREMRGVSLADIAKETRIGTRFLEALENEDFSMFSGIFYIRYYIKNYLQACGADEKVFFNTYHNYLKAILDKKGSPPPDQLLHKLEYVKFKKRKTIIILLLLLLLLAAFFYWFLGRQVLLKKQAEPIEFPAFSASLFFDESDFCLDWTPVSMRLTFQDSCWLQFWRGGEKVIEKTFVKGDVLIGQGYQLTLVMGNPAVVRLNVNGRELPALAQSDTAVKLLFSPDNLEGILSR